MMLKPVKNMIAQAQRPRKGPQTGHDDPTANVADEHNFFEIF